MISYCTPQLRSNGLLKATRRGAAVAFGLALLGACADSSSTAAGLDASESASASHGWDGGNQNAPSRAVSYINPDIGAPTANPDVNPNSNCFSPDQSDTQKLSPAGTTTNNVHNDACFFDNWNWNGATKVDGPASFVSSGVGIINACPDPDNAGPKIAILSADRKSCFQSGYQEKGVAGDLEFHARLNSTSATGGAGTQTVVWCYDPERNGCSDTYIKSTIRINWVP